MTCTWAQALRSTLIYYFLLHTSNVLGTVSSPFNFISSEVNVDLDNVPQILSLRSRPVKGRDRFKELGPRVFVNKVK